MKPRALGLGPVCWLALSLQGLALPGRAEEPARAGEGKGPLAVFCLGDGPNQPAAAQTQRLLREIAPGLATGRLVDLELLLHVEGVQDARRDLQKAESLLNQGKASFEKLELEKAEQRLQRAWDRLTDGFAHVDRPEVMSECALYLGATWALMGKQDKAQKLFLTLQDLPGDKKVESQVFPPNILDMLAQAAKKAQGAPRGALQIQSEPAGAEIHVDGVFAGITPAEIPGLRSGAHLVRLVLDGYASQGGSVRVSATKLRKASFKLKPAPRLAALTRLLQQASAESSSPPPAKALASLGEFLRAEQVILVLLNGSGSTINHRGFSWQASAPTCRSAEEPLAVQLDEYPARLREFLTGLLATEESQPARRPVEAPAAPSAGGPRNPPRADSTLSVQRLDTPKTPTSESSLSPKQKPKAIEEPFSWNHPPPKATPRTRDPLQWRNLRKQWWFWTAVGVLSAGALVGGIVLLIPDDATTGSLVIDLH